MFVDQVKIYVRGGDGGNGMADLAAAHYSSSRAVVAELWCGLPSTR